MVVVGEELSTSRPVSFLREDPPGGGPAAGLLAGVHGFPRAPRQVVAARRRHAAGDDSDGAAPDASATEEDGAVLVDDDDRQQYLCAVYRIDALLAAAPRRPVRSTACR